MILNDTYLDQFDFRWLEVKGIYTAFPISITLFFNHLKWNSSNATYNTAIQN